MTAPVTALVLALSLASTGLLALVRPIVARSARGAVDATALSLVWSAFVVALAALGAGHVDDRFVLAAADGLGLGLGEVVLRADGVALAVVGTVFAITAVTVRYTATQLRDDPRLSRLLGAMGLASSAAVVLATSAHLALTGIAFVVASAGLTTMLTHHDERPTAHSVARRKFWVSRVGDAALALSVIGLGRAYGTYDLDVVLGALARDGATAPPTYAAVSLVVAVLCKSALFPMHGWLPDTLEAPTGVSALMHAGIVNAGCILLVRCEPILASSTAATTVLLVAAVSSIALGGLAALAQTEVKRALAFSTVGQMGFTALEVALGAPTLALLHTLGHAVYKAHAFLASGDLASGVRPVAALPPPRVAFQRGVGITLGAAGLGATVAYALGAGAGHGGMAMGAVMAVAVATAMPLAPRSRADLLTSLGVAVVFGAVWALVAEGFHRAFAEDLAPTVALEVRGAEGRILALLTVVALVATSALARFAPAFAAAGRLLGLHVAARHGFYAGAFHLPRRRPQGARDLSTEDATTERTP